MQLKTRNCKLINIVLYLLTKIHFLYGCGPQGGYRRVGMNYLKFNRMPQISEYSIQASGRYEGPLRRDNPRLRHTLNTNIIFKRPTYESNNRKSTLTCKRALIELEKAVKLYWNNSMKLYVVEGYVDINLKSLHGYQSKMHFAGRAFDISLMKTPTKTSNKLAPGIIIKTNHMLMRLAHFAYYETHFSYVEIKKWYIHASCKTKVPTHYTSRCFPGDSFVRNIKGEKLLMKNVKIGDKLLSMNENRQPVYSEVVMMMHKSKYTRVENYIVITTSKMKIITLSAYHLIFISKTQSIFAKDVKLGQYVFIYDVSSNKFITSTVTNTSIVSKLGVYAPLTMEGAMIVDDVYASCYALFPSHSISHAVFWVWRTLYPYLKHTESFMKSNTEYHWYADVFRRSMNYFNIFHYSF